MMHNIIYHICKFYGIPSKQIFADTRKATTIFYRHLFFYLSKDMMKKVSYREIIEFAFEHNYNVKQNHATLVNGVKKIKDRLSYDKDFREDLENLKERIQLHNEPEIIIKHIDLLSLCAKNI